MKTLMAILMFFAPMQLDILNDVAAAIKSGNASAVSTYFADNVDMKILDQENIYSKAQAELILKDFFAKHAVKGFTIAHTSAARTDSQYAIGTLETANGKYRVHYLLKKNASGTSSISQFRIETDE